MLERAGLADMLIQLVSRNQERPELVRLFTVLAAESVDADHPGHDRFVARYRDVRSPHGRADRRGAARGGASAPRSPPRRSRCC